MWVHALRSLAHEGHAKPPAMAFRSSVIARNVGVALAGFITVACGDDGGECAEGTEGCACYPNESCNDDLSCLSNLCVDPDGKPDDDESDGGKVDEAGDGGGNGNPDDTNNPNDTNNPDDTNPGNSDGGGGGDGNPDDTNGPGPVGTNPDDTDSPNNPDDTSDGTFTPGDPPAGSPVAEHGALRVSGTHLVDKDGKSVQLKGVSSMWLNWENDGFAEDKAGLEFMRDNWNLSLIRAAMGVEVDDDGESPTYLTDPAHAKAQVEKIVQNAIELGVYVIIDWHDHEAIAHQADAQAFFAEMAEKYGDVPNVLYEVFNEPLDLSWTGELKPYHEALRDTIRTEDSDNVIILGTPNWDQDVDVAAGSPLSGENLMYTLHFYSCTHTTYPYLDKANVALNAGLPLFVSEWGAADNLGKSTNQSCITEAGLWHDWMDANGISWAAWKFDNCVDATCFFPASVTETGGGWSESDLNGLHPQFAVTRMKKEYTPVVVEPNPDPDPACTPSGTCADGNAMDCDAEGELVARDCSACALLPDPSYCGQVTHFGAVSQPTFATQPSLVTSFSSDETAATLNMTFDFDSFPSAYEQIGAIAFELSGEFAISPSSFSACLETSDSAHTQVSLESGASGCLYYLYVYPFDEQLGCSPTAIDYPSDGTCWGDWLGLGSPSYVSQINLRIGSETSGAGQLVVRSVDW
jgi:endoglucanase